MFAFIADTAYAEYFSSMIAAQILLFRMRMAKNTEIGEYKSWYAYLILRRK